MSAMLSLLLLTIITTSYNVVIGFSPTINVMIGICLYIMGPFALSMVLLLYLYLQYGLDYAVGSAEYTLLNNTVASGQYKEVTWNNLCNEVKELRDALRAWSIVDIVLELGDVVHSIIKYSLIKYVPEWMYCSVLCWLLVFPFALSATIKCGIRYRQHKCIRNHRNKNNCNHQCNYGG